MVYNWFLAKWSNTCHPAISHLLPQTQKLSTQGDPGTCGGPTRAWWRRVLSSLEGKVWRTTPIWGDQSPSHTGHYCHHHCSEMCNRAIHCLWVGHSMQSSTRYISSLGPKAPSSWSEMNSTQQVKGKCCHFRGMATDSSGDLWSWMRPGSVIASQRWSIV